MLSPEELARYDRHLTLPEVGREGQEKLKSARLLLVGTGGLGSPAALYLAAAGVGCLGVMDFDVVEESNLQRQVMHGSKNVGSLKTASARERLSDLNPFIEVVTHEGALSSSNALDIIAAYDIVVDGTDNFPARYLVNDACVLLGKPNVYGSIFRFQGQVSVFHPSSGGPCYRCLHADPPPPGTVPSCAEGGVLGVLPGVIGTLQATEAVKWILGCGRPLLGRLLLFDALQMKFREMALPRDPDCRLCGPNATVSDLLDYQDFCGLRRSEGASDGEIEPLDLQARWAAGEQPVVLDVREPHEWEIANLQELGAQLIPLGSLQERLSSLDPRAATVVYCKSGRRSAEARATLQRAGFADVRSLSGGILRWATDVDNGMRKY